MLPSECIGCPKSKAVNLDGLHPFIASVEECGIYDNTNLGWVSRRGCSFNTHYKGEKVIKLNPLKASKRARRG